jgi:hypothetical protein
MAPLDQLAAELLGQSAQKDIASENIYNKAKAIPDSYTNNILSLVGRDPGRYSSGEIAANTAISGLISGLLGSFGEDRQQTLTDRYTSAIGNIIAGKDPSQEDTQLNTKLFNLATNKGEGFLKQQALADLTKEKAYQESTSNAIRTQLLKKSLPGLFSTGKESAGQAVLPPTLQKTADKLIRKMSDPNNKEEITDEDYSNVSKGTKDQRTYMQSLFTQIGSERRHQSGLDSKDLDRDREDLEKVIGDWKAVGPRALTYGEAEASKLRSENAKIAKIFTALDKVRGGSKWSLTGAPASLDKAALSYLQTAIDGMVQDQRTDAKTRDILRSIVPSSLVKGQIAGVAIDTLTDRTRQDVVDIVKRLFGDAFEAKMEGTYNQLKPGKIYSTDYIRDYAKRTGATAADIKAAGIYWE